MMKINEDAYRVGLKHSNGGTARQLVDMLAEVEKKDRDWKPQTENEERPDFEAQSFSMIIGFVDGLINRLRR